VKNVQVVDGAANSTFEIYAVPEDVFESIFPGDRNVAFARDVERGLGETGTNEVVFWRRFYERRMPKTKVQGIHGTLHLTGSFVEEQYFPTRREEDALE
jgi:hypothetical protein